MIQHICDISGDVIYDVETRPDLDALEVNSQKKVKVGAGRDAYFKMYVKIEADFRPPLAIVMVSNDGSGEAVFTAPGHDFKKDDEIVIWGNSYQGERKVTKVNGDDFHIGVAFTVDEAGYVRFAGDPVEMKDFEHISQATAIEAIRDMVKDL